MRSALTVLALALALLGCRHEPRAQWVPLARVPGEPRAAGLLRAELPGGQEIEFEERDGETWGKILVRREAWGPSELPNVLAAPAPLLGLGKPVYQLEIGGKTCTPFASLEEGGLKVKKNFRPGTFGFFRNSICLGIAPGESPPEVATLRVRLDTGARDAQGFEEIHGRRFSGRGLAVWPGRRIELVLDIPQGSALSFGTVLESASALVSEHAANVFRIRVDDTLVFEHAQRHDVLGTHTWHRVELPERKAARLVFEVEGPFAFTHFSDPVLGPAATGSYAARPWPSRPSIVLFLADTFRADNLSFYGGPEGITPELGRFAEQGLRFAHAWSVGTFTLPGHAALFSGLYPRQTSSDAFNRALPSEVQTIAELLTRAGYRTGAITDSVVVSLRFGLHQGFTWFDEFDLTLASTLERARRFLDADDGRPVFLFVQTYRTHAPYRAEEPESATPLAILEGTEEYFRLRKVLGDPPWGARDPEGTRAVAQDLLALYRRAARDLDRGFGALWRDLGARGFPEAGYVVFTSDHGEAFFEHDELEHMGRVFGEQVEIPLLISGPRLASRTVEQPASLVDLPPTLAAMAGLPPLSAWRGTNLLALEADRALFAFECAQQDSTVAILSGSRKLIVREDAGGLGAPWRAFDLARDPGETRDLLDAGGAPWSADVLRAATPVVEALLVPLVSDEASALDAERVEELNALGYVAD